MDTDEDGYYIKKAGNFTEYLIPAPIRKKKSKKKTREKKGTAVSNLLIIFFMIFVWHQIS